MKPTTLVFYQKDPGPAKALALSLRTGLNLVGVRAAVNHMGEERETCERVIVMPDVMPDCRQELHRLFEDRVEIFGSSEAMPVIKEVSTVLVKEEEVPRPRKRRIVTAETR